MQMLRFTHQCLRLVLLLVTNSSFMLLTVIIPTYKRPHFLNNCLKGLRAQRRLPDEVIVTVREDDVETIDLLSQWKDALPIKEVRLTRPGMIIALNEGCARATGDIVCLTDDDAVPRCDWLQKIESTFLADARIGAVGGMDILRSGGDIPKSYTLKVGLITTYGRVLGNHHAGMGPARRVDHLKGVNMSLRVSAAGTKPFITDLQGHGAQVFGELALCFRLEREGWEIIYDPAILVDHYVAVRFDEDNRAQRSVAALQHAAFNFYLAFLRERRPGWKRTSALVWARLIGIRGMPGVLRELYFKLRRDEQGIAIGRATRRAWSEARQHARARV